ncbi:MAG: glycosyltransferase family 39 protein, partial [Polyangiaceae bacterium]
MSFDSEAGQKPAEPAELARPPFRERAARTIRASWQEAVIVLALLAFFLWIRLLTLEPIEIGGDAIQKWFFVRRWAFSSPFEGTVWNHHLTRMGDNLPVFFIQRLFGTSPPVYYVGPLLAFLVTAFTLYALGKRMSGRLLGVLAAIGLTLFGPMRRAASQMVPSVFSAMYITLGAYCLLRYAVAEPRDRRRWLLGTAVSIFGAYLSHEPNLYFLPAFVVIVWLYGKRWQDLALLLGVLLALFLVETAVYASFTEHLSRLHITMLTHGSRGSIKIGGFWGLLGRYDSPDFTQDFRRYFYVFPFAALGVALLGRTRFERLVPLVPFTFLFLMTFLVRGIDPIRTWTSFQSRYLVAAVPLITLTNVLFLLRLVTLVTGWLGRVLNGSRASESWRRFTLAFEPLRTFVRQDVVWIVALVLALGVRAYPAEGLAAKIAGHPLVT